MSVLVFVMFAAVALWWDGGDRPITTVVSMGIGWALGDLILWLAAR